MKLSIFTLLFSLLLTNQALANSDTPLSSSPDTENTSPEKQLLLDNRKYEQGRLAYMFGDFTTAKRLWGEMAENEHARAITALAWMHHTGQGYPKSLKKAIELYQQASQLGETTAMNNLATLYETGVGVEKDRQTALSFYLSAAQSGYGIAQYNYAKLLRNSSRTPSREVVTWLSRAAEHGIKEARDDLQSWNYKNLRLASKALPKETTRIHKLEKPSRFPASNFTIALMSSSDPDDFQKLIHQHKLSGDFFQIDTGSHGKRWLTLLLGSYSSGHDVNRQFDALPASLRNGASYIRQFSDIVSISKLRKR